MNLLMKARMEKGISIRQLSRLSGLAINTINGAEKEWYIPRFENADRIAHVLELPVELLFPFFCRRSTLPGWKDIMYLKSCGCDISAYKILLEFLRTTKEQR